MSSKRKIISITIASLFMATLGTASMTAAADTSTRTHQSLKKGDQLAYADKAEAVSEQSGQVGDAEHGGMMKSKGKHHKCGMFRADTDKDGKVSREEFMQQSERKFDKKDMNKDGFIDKDEMHQMMKRMHGGDKAHSNMKE